VYSLVDFVSTTSVKNTIKPRISLSQPKPLTTMTLILFLLVVHIKLGMNLCQIYYTFLSQSVETNELVRESINAEARDVPHFQKKVQENIQNSILNTEH
jgi:hypothetical protein